MKPIVITWLVTPLILFVVGAVYLWWQRTALASSTKRRILAWLRGANLVLGILGTWYWANTARSDFDVWMCVCLGTLWAWAAVDAIRRVRNKYKHNASQLAETKANP
jgi:hypothetical protein